MTISRRLFILITLLSAALLISCIVDRRSSSYECRKNGKCQKDYTCVDGWCLANSTLVDAGGLECTECLPVTDDDLEAQPQPNSAGEARADTAGDTDAEAERAASARGP